MGLISRVIPESSDEALICLTSWSGVGTDEAVRRRMALATTRRPDTPTPSRGTLHFIVFPSSLKLTHSRSRKMNQVTSHKRWFMVFVPKQAKHH